VIKITQKICRIFPFDRYNLLLNSLQKAVFYVFAVCFMGSPHENRVKILECVIYRELLGKLFIDFLKATGSDIRGKRFFVYSGLTV